MDRYINFEVSAMYRIDLRDMDYDDAQRIMKAVCNGEDPLQIDIPPGHEPFELEGTTQFIKPEGRSTAYIYEDRGLSGDNILWDNYKKVTGRPVDAPE